MKMKSTYLHMFALVFLFIGCTIKNGFASNYSQNGSRQETDTTSCIDLKKSCLRNKNCSEIFKKVKQNCQYFRHTCTATDENLSDFDKENVEKRYERSPQPSKQELCTEYLNDLAEVLQDKKSCDCPMEGLSRRNYKRCEQIYNLIFANPCLKKEFDNMDHLFPGFPINDETEEKDKSVDLKIDDEIPVHSKPIFSDLYFENSTASYVETPFIKKDRQSEPKNAETNLEVRHELKERSTPKGHTERSTIAKTNLIDDSLNPNNHNEECDAMSDKENILIIAFLVSGFALLMFLLFGVGICYRKFKNIKKQHSSVPHDTSEVVKLKSEKIESS